MGDRSSPDVAVPESDDERSITAVADGPAVTRERAPEVQPGDVLAGRYQVEAIIGKGGSGIVLRAFDRVSATVVAVKVLKSALTHDPRWDKRFSRELRLGRPIRHPNVCRIFDIGEADGYRFLTMEYATRGTLRDLVKKNEPLRSLQERVADASGAIAGLAAIHAAGIVHRDVKPDNMLRMEDGRLALSDFGLATDLPDATMVSVFVGTPHYMAPEVREGDPATTRSDVWSLGVVLQEIFTGRRPERRSSRSGASGARGPMGKTSSTIERAMLALCERCLADDPAERPEDATAVKDLFERSRRSPGAILRTSGRAPFVWVAVAAIVAAGGILGARAYRSARGPQTALHTGMRSVAATGEPVNWSGRARPVATVPGRVHCFSLVSDRTAQLIWGTPRRAEDVDVVTGQRRPSRLAPETYATGCPVLAPDGSALLFTVDAHEGVSELRLSNSSEGVPSKSIAPGSEPVWLSNSREFLYDIDPSHAAVFSLSTMTFVLLPESGLGGRQMIAAKAASRKGNLIALLLVDEKSEWAVAIHEGAGFDLRWTFAASPGRYLQFDESDRLLISEGKSPLQSSLAQADRRSENVRRLGAIPGREIIGAFPGPASMLLLARRSSSDVWLHSGTSKRRMTTDGRNFSAAISATGELLVSKWADDGAFLIWRQSNGGALRVVTQGPNDTSPDFSPDGSRWAYVDYLKKSLMICSMQNNACTTLTRDELLPAWPRFSPDGKKLAYVTQIGTPRLLVVSLDGSGSEQIGPMHLECPPVWSSRATIWSLEGAGKRRYWLERQVAGGAVTGKRIDLADGRVEGCWPEVADPDSPFFNRVEIETEQTTELRRLDQMGG